MLCNQLHKFENVLSQVVTFKIWNPMFKNIGNRLHAHDNRLLLCKTVIKLFGLLVIDYCLLVIDYQRVKTMVKDFSLKNSFEQIVIFNLFFLKKYFYTYIDVFLEVLAYLESSLESSLEYWLNDSLILETCFLDIIKINLESFASTDSYVFRKYHYW